MGLDTVELVMAIEEEFGIEIPNTDAPNLAVLGDMHDYIIRALRQRGDAPEEGQVWERLSAVVVAQLGVRPDAVTDADCVFYFVAARRAMRSEVGMARCAVRAAHQRRNRTTVCDRTTRCRRTRLFRPLCAGGAIAARSVRAPP